MKSRRLCVLLANVPLASSLVGADATLADPVNKMPLKRVVSVMGGVVSARRVSTSGAVFPERAQYIDLLPTASRSALTLSELRNEVQEALETRVQTGLFRSPFTAFLYERGWRQNFANAGFPGIDAEFREVNEFFEPAAGGVVVDMSCGSGLMTRRLVTSGKYERVLALDYSEAMLTETARRIREEGVPTARLTLCRADVASLPLRAGSVDAMHAGAAMHCWPRLEEGLQQIRQALKPDGGRFFATTFLQGAYGSAMPQQTAAGGGSFRFFESEQELEQLLVAAGFPREGVSVRREGRGCAVIKAELPAASASADDDMADEAIEEAEEAPPTEAPALEDLPAAFEAEAEVAAQDAGDLAARYKAEVAAQDDAGDGGDLAAVVERLE